MRSLTEAECYAHWDGTVKIVRLEPRRPRHPVLLNGEVLRRRFEEALDAREADAVAEEAA